MKKGYRINNAEQLKEKITSLNSERDLIHESVNLNKDIEQEKRIVKEGKQKNNEMEL